TAAGQGLARDLFEGVAGRAPLPVARLAIAAAAFALFLVFVRILSLAWAFLRLYDFRLARVGEDLRTEYGLFTKVATTIPVRRVQAITIHVGPLQRWLERASVTVATAGGAGGDSATQGRERLAPLIRERAMPDLLREIVPGFDLDAVEWQPVHPHAFARAIKPSLIFSTLITLIASLFLGVGAMGLAMVLLTWSAVSTHLRVKHLGWAEQEDVVMMRSGWLWQSITLARVNKIQAVTMQESPFDRRAAMAAVRVDTAGAGELSHRVAIPYLDRDVAANLAQRLAGAAANVAFRW
ncbi:MAG TPA: PH domain-containing protein, partial [Vicinamibacterales bacterium]